MRVISGIRRGHRLKSPQGLKVRPTEDRVKESLFNILGPISDKAIALDCFAGSGSIGIEFLSRGARMVYFIDVFYKSIACIEENLEHTKLTDKSIVKKMDIIRFLKTAARDGLSFDYIYIDPPFEQLDLSLKVTEEIVNGKVLSDDGLIIIEHDDEIKVSKDLKLVDIREYGSKNISFYRYSN